MCIINIHDSIGSIEVVHYYIIIIVAIEYCYVISIRFEIIIMFMQESTNNTVYNDRKRANRSISPHNAKKLFTVANKENTRTNESSRPKPTVSPYN